MYCQKAGCGKELKPRQKTYEIKIGERSRYDKRGLHPYLVPVTIKYCASCFRKYVKKHLPLPAST